MYTLILRGNILTPLVTKKVNFRIHACDARILHPRRRYYSKINASKPMFPYSFICYLGEIELLFKTDCKLKAKQKLSELLRIQAIGRFTSEGLGLVQWINGTITKNHNLGCRLNQNRKVRIRKGLPHTLPNNVQKLLKYALLHDFVATPKHKSKIYVEPELEDLEHLRRHHDKTNDPFIQLFQKYDRLSAIITRKIRSPRTNRYNWSSQDNIDFEQLANEITAVSTNIWKLYDYIYQSTELGQLTESLQHGYTSLRSHLLIIANLLVRDYQRKKL